MKKRFFGTDGIRGTFNKFPIITSFFYDLAKSIKITHPNIKKILIGKDTRESGDDIERDISTGLNRVGIKCHSCGLVSTPILSFNTKKYNYDMGIMISASHNPYQDNGVKLFKRNGEKLSDIEELEIEKNISINNISEIKQNFDCKILSKNFTDYQEMMFKKFSKLSNFCQKVVVDCSNGSLSYIAPHILKKLNFNYLNYASKPNGKNINNNCGATFPKILSELTIKNKADIGISFDGDADRVIFCDQFGKIVDGDFILAILSLDLKSSGKLKNNTIVSTKMSNLGFRRFLKDNNIDCLLSDVGDRYVIDIMKKNQSSLGGEQSGHIIFSNNSYCGDGLFTALSIIEILQKKKCSLATLCKKLYKKVPQKLINLKLTNDTNKVLSNSKIKGLLKNQIETEDCDILLRKSGTENLLRLMVQADSQRKLDSIKNKFIDQIKQIDEK